MTSVDRKRLLDGFNGNPPATSAAISQLEAAARLRLPADYLVSCPTNA